MITELYAAIKEFYEILYSRRDERLETWLEKIENFNFNWNKSIEANCIKYLATDKNGKNIEIQYIPNNQEKTDSVLLYDNQPLKYANYNINAVVNIIEKAIKDKLFEENIIQNLPF